MELDRVRAMPGGFFAGGLSRGELPQTEALLRDLHIIVEMLTENPGPDTAAAAATECQAAYRNYADALRDSAAAGRMGSALDAAEATNAARAAAEQLWSLVRGTVLAPEWHAGDGVIELLRSRRTPEHISGTVVVTDRCREALRSAAEGLSLSKDELEAPIASLVRLADHASSTPALEGAFGSAARNWLQWAAADGSPHVSAILPGLAQLGHGAEAALLLRLVMCFGSFALGLDPGSHIMMLLGRVEHLLSSHAQMLAQVQRGSELSSLFTRWRQMLAASGQDIEQARAELASEPLMGVWVNAAEVVLDLLSGTQHDGLDWLDILGLCILYQVPSLRYDGPPPTVPSTLRAVLQSLEIAEQDFQDMEPLDRIVLKLLSGDEDGFFSSIPDLRVPGLEAHMAEVFAVGGRKCAAAECVSELLAEHAADTFMAAPQLWRQALDYSSWAGGTVGLTAATSIISRVSLDSGGMDRLVRWTETCDRLDEVGLRKAGLAALRAHGHGLLSRGVLVAGVERLLQAGDYDGLRDELHLVLHHWAARVNDAITPGDAKAGSNWAPLQSMAAALASPHQGSLTALVTRARDDLHLWVPEKGSYIGAPPPTWADYLMLAQQLGALASAADSSDLVKHREATDVVLCSRAASGKIKLAALRLAIRLFAARTRFYTVDAVSELLGLLSRCEDEEGASDVADAVRTALMRQASVAACFETPSKTHVSG